MLYYFLSINEDSYELFKDLKIAQKKEFMAAHLNKYPVIFLSFKDIKAANFSTFCHETIELFKALYSKFDYLLTSEHLKGNYSYPPQFNTRRR